MRLILFSGGIESTALLTIANPEDVALIVQPSLNGDFATYKDFTAQQIAYRFGVRLAYAKALVPDPGPFHFVHQMTVFISLCNLAVARDPKITEVWCGRNSAEPSFEIKDYIEQNMAAWKILHPTVPFLHPLDHLSKMEQWERIPLDVQPLVSSCIYHNNCGKCNKCEEKKWVYRNLQDVTNN